MLGMIGKGENKSKTNNHPRSFRAGMDVFTLNDFDALFLAEFQTHLLELELLDLA